MIFSDWEVFWTKCQTRSSPKYVAFVETKRSVIIIEIWLIQCYFCMNMFIFSKKFWRCLLWVMQSLFQKECLQNRCKTFISKLTSIYLNQCLNLFTKQVYKCYFDNKCKIDAITRKFCRKCRLRKCFEIGMKQVISCHSLLS